ncbi:MAG: putative membrane protein [Gammaproteobacteria bacterium]
MLYIIAVALSWWIRSLAVACHNWNLPFRIVLKSDMIDINKKEDSSTHRLILSPNCSTDWQGIKLFFALTCLLSATIALLFSINGMWLVLPFYGLELSLLGFGLYITSRQSHRCEVITIEPEKISVEKGFNRPVQKWRFERAWVGLQDEVNLDVNGERILAIGSHGIYVEVGSFLSKFEKEELAFQLKDCILRR